MSIFEDQEVSAEWFVFSDSDSKKKTSINFDEDDSTTITINKIRISDLDGIVEGDILGEYRANVDQSGIKRGDVIWFSSTDIYRVVKKPRYNKLFNKYHLNMKKVDA